MKCLLVYGQNSKIYLRTNSVISAVFFFKDIYLDVCYNQFAKKGENHMKVAFYTLGCKVNTYDTQSVWEEFESRGYERVEFDELADVYIINTCTVTNQADSKSRKMVRNAIKRNEGAVIVVMGCYAQVAPEVLAEIDGVDLVTGTKNRKEIVEHVEEILQTRKQIIAVTKVDQMFEDMKVTTYKENTRAFLKIQDGCDVYCHFCIIPFARGEVTSKPMDSVLEEAKTLTENGYKELVLTGIHTGKYGVDLGTDLTTLVKELIKLPKLKRLRISSVEMNELTDELVSLVATHPKMARHLHIPLQSGSTTVLRKMNRKYTAEFYKEKLDYIRSINPEIAITADVIVGYPTETDELFEEAVNFIQSCKFSELHVFPFSKRNGTPAAKLKDLPGDVKQARVHRLLEVNKDLATNYRKQFEGKTLELIVEQNKPVVGHTSNYLTVEASGVYPKNTMINVQIVEAGYPVSKAIVIE